MTDNSVGPVPQNTWEPSCKVLVFFSLLGGLIGFAVFHAIHPVFAFATSELPSVPTEEQLQQYIVSLKEFLSRNNAVDMAVIGACMGGAIGIGTVRSRRFSSGLFGGIAGLLCGAWSGYVTGFPSGDAVSSTADKSLIQAGVLHFAVWCAIAVGIATTISFVQGGMISAFKGVLAGLITSLLVVVTHTIAASVLFPTADLAHVVPRPLAERAVWMLACSAMFGIALSFGLRPAKPGDLAGKATAPAVK